MHLLNTLPLPLILSYIHAAVAATCNLKPSYSTPITYNGWQAQLIAQGLSKPRSVLFDSSGNLLVVQSGAGIIRLRFDDGGSTCLDVSQMTYLVNSTDLNHGIALSNDGKTLYASSSNSVFSWSYDADAASVSDTNQTIVTRMSNDDHTTRTLLVSQKTPGLLLVSRSSNSNIDPEAEDLDSGHSQIRAFTISNLTSDSPAYDFTTSGLLLGWGLRNSVGMAEELVTGGIYSIENSADEIQREGMDIHQNNPGEEMNFHGFLNGSTQDQGGNYGYPTCLAVWSRDIPDLGDLQTGSQMALVQNASVNDTFFNQERVAPRLTFQAHMAPLDLTFLPNGTQAYVTFHGSWDRTSPVGYKLSTIAFSYGSPTASSNSQNSTIDIMTNADNSKCPDACFRPVGLALDEKGRVFMSSDATGELWVLDRTGVDNRGQEIGGSQTSSGASPSTTKKNRAGRREVGCWMVVLGAIVGFAVLM